MTTSLTRPSASSTVPIALWTAAAALFLLAWDAAGPDLPMARWFGGPQGFGLRDHWFLYGWLHEGVRRFNWGIEAALWLMVWWPLGFLARVPRGRRVQLALTTLLALLVVSLIKSTSRTSCPWDLAEFGGIAQHVSHWAWGMADGGPGRCFPAGHASAGFAFIGGYFALRHDAARAARIWLAASVAVGLLLGLVQQVRGAHYMSHTLWTAWLCWTTAWVADLVATRWLAHRAARQLNPA